MKKLFLCLLLGLIGLLNNVNAQKKLNFLVEPEVGLGCTNISKEIETDGFAVDLALNAGVKYKPLCWMTLNFLVGACRYQYLASAYLDNCIEHHYEEDESFSHIGAWEKRIKTQIIVGPRSGFLLGFGVKFYRFDDSYLHGEDRYDTDIHLNGEPNKETVLFLEWGCAYDHFQLLFNVDFLENRGHGVKLCFLLYWGENKKEE
ncbi:MAG TPA: hypothetical protein PLN63_10285 [Paludibacteraceae bacterium]|nr:hypothetical protein [Paludibacteraceae bacterium]HPH63985.1 hypothetical protein [Paludibacteraceae bacterium]HQF49839.1 hypothetical protein [Paludibacteraceae bacterium]